MTVEYGFEGGSTDRVFEWKAGAGLGYAPTHNFDANNCEYFLDGTHGSYFHRGEANRETVTLYFAVNRDALIMREGGRLRALAAYVREPNGEGLRAWIVVARDDRLPLCFESGGTRYEPHAKIHDFAFFLDVERASGAIDRLWLKNGACNFGVPDIENFRIYGYPFEYYLSESSPLFNQKKAALT